jgi:hypothetical protein
MEKARMKTLSRYSLAIDESSDRKDITQLAVFIRGIDSDLAAYEYIFDVH